MCGDDADAAVSHLLTNPGPGGTSAAAPGPTKLSQSAPRRSEEKGGAGEVASASAAVVGVATSSLVRAKVTSVGFDGVNLGMTAPRGGEEVFLPVGMLAAAHLRALWFVGRLPRPSPSRSTGTATPT